MKYVVEFNYYFVKLIEVNCEKIVHIKNVQI